MIKDCIILKQTLLEYLKETILKQYRDGVMICLDGTLMSLVNLKLVELLDKRYTKRACLCIVSKENNTFIDYTNTILEGSNIQYEYKDLSEALEKLDIYKFSKGDYQLEIILKQRLIESQIKAEADKYNSLTISNLCYSQWVLNYPNRAYKDLGSVHLLNRLFYSELKELAKDLGISSIFIDKNPTHYLYRGQLDQQDLGFTYDQLEYFLRTKEIQKPIDLTINNKIYKEDRHLYLGPVLTRPSNILG